MLTNARNRTDEEIVDLFYAMAVTEDFLGLTPTERVVLWCFVLGESRGPIARARICATAKIGKDTYYEVLASLADKGLIERFARPGKAAEVVTSLPLDVVQEIIATALARGEERARAAQLEGAPPGQGALPGQGQNGHRVPPQGTLPPQGVPPQGTPKAQRVPPQGTPEGGGCPPRAPSDGAHITTRAHTRARALHGDGLSLKEEKKVERVVVEDTAPTTLFAADEMSNGPRINGSKIVWTDPKGEPQALPFRIIDEIIPETSRGKGTLNDVREWARAEIDIAVIDGRDGNLTRWLRAMAPKSWPRWMEMRKRNAPEGSLSTFAPPKKPRSEKLEPWEG